MNDYTTIQIAPNSEGNEITIGEKLGAVAYLNKGKIIGYIIHGDSKTHKDRVKDGEDSGWEFTHYVFIKATGWNYYQGYEKEMITLTLKGHKSVVGHKFDKKTFKIINHNNHG